MKLEKISILLLAFALASCGDSNGPASQLAKEISNGDSAANSQSLRSTANSFNVTLERVTEISEDLSNIDVFARNINRFVVNVEAQNGKNEGGKLRCRKQSAMVFNNVRTTTFTNFGTQAKLELSLDKTDEDAVTFSCEVTDSSQNKTLKTFEQTIRKGYVVNQTQNINELGPKDIDTLVLMKHSEVLFGSLKDRLVVNNLISHDAHISTFSAESVLKTPDNQNGESGGELRLEVVDLKGDLTFNLRGKNGGVQTRTPERPAQNPNRGAGGNCPRSCHGQQGPQGFPANDGLTGYDGGATGSIILSIENKTDAEITINYAPGVGSEGSKPSLPGLGGLGGLPGSYLSQPIGCGVGGSSTFRSSNSNKCVGRTITGQVGPQGPLGPQGEMGDSGETGQIVRSLYTNDAEGIDELVLQSWSNLRGPL